MPMPLEAIRVIDWTIFQQGPIAGVMLADLGAKVIKIEDRVTGDPARGLMVVLGATAGLKGRNAYYEYNNRGKRGITLDLRKERRRLGKSFTVWWRSRMYLSITIVVTSLKG